MVGFCKFLVLFILLLSAAVFPLSGQEAGKLSMMVSPEVTIPVGSPTEMFLLGGGAELSGVYPLPFAPWLAARGAVDFRYVPIASDDISEPLNLFTFSAGAGPVFKPASWLTLFAFGSGGYGLGLYDRQIGGSAYFGADAGLAFNFSPTISICAASGYRHYLSDPDPFYQGINISIGTFISFGTGDDNPKIDIRNIRINPVFPVFYSYYDDHRIGNINLNNEESGKIEDVRISLYIQQYMDSPKLCAEIDSIGVNGNAEIISEYSYGGMEKTKRDSITMRLYDRNAMSWDDDRKAAAFVTAKDPDILRFSKNIAGIVREQQNGSVPLNFRVALGLLEGLRLQGLSYVSDPAPPYADFSEDSAAVDYLQFPSQTLDYKAGDCDDLSILYSALLESTGIETAFITVPGHIFAAFSLGIGADEAAKLFRQSGDLITIGDALWLPVEVTMLQQGFLKAWDSGAKQWREYNSAGTAKLIPVHDAWTEYEPVGLSGNAMDITFPPQADIKRQYTAAYSAFVDQEITDEVQRLETRIAESVAPAPIQNKLGVLYARYGLIDEAETLFRLAAADQHLPAIINSGNLLYLRHDYEGALEYYQRAEKMRPGHTAALLGIARTSYELEHYGTLNQAYEKLQLKSPESAAEFSYLASGYDDETRASSAIDRLTVNWAEEYSEGESR